MAEELLMEKGETTTFAEINAQYQAGDLNVVPPADVTPPADAPPKDAPPAEPVNWETKYKEVETNYAKEKETYLREINEHKAKVEELSKKPPPITHKDSDLSRLEVVKQANPEKFPLYTKLLWGNPDAAELWKMDFVEKNPKYKDNPEMVNMMLEAEYEHYFDPDIDRDSKEYKIAAAKLEIAGEQIKAAKLAEFKAIHVDDPQEVAQTQEQQKKDLAKSWEIPFAEMTKNPLKVSQKIALDDKSEIEVDFGLQAEDSKKYTDLMGLYLLHNDLKPSAENAQKARDFAMGEILRDKFVDIFKSTFQKELDKRYTEWQKSRNNNRQLATSQFSKDGKKTIDQEVQEFLEHGEAHVPNI